MNFPEIGFDRLKRQSGYTLVELLIVIVVSSITGVVISQTYLFSVKWISRWRSNLALERSAHFLMAQVTEDMMYAEGVLMAGDSLWIVKPYEGKDIRYFLADSSVTRNKLRLHDEEVAVSDFLIEINQHYDLDIEASNNEVSKRLWRIEFKLNSNHSSVELASSIAARQPVQWPDFRLW